MKYVEMLGLPGSGKTTLMKKITNENKLFITQQEAYLKGILSTLDLEKMKMLNNFIETSKVFYCISKIVRKMARFFYLNSKKTKEILRDSLSDEIKSLLTAIDSYIEDSNGLDRKYLNAARNGLVISYERHVFSKLNYSPKSIVIMDEGLLKCVQGIYAIPNAQSFNKSGIDFFLRRIPIPDAIVRLSSSRERCLERMRNRKEGFPVGYCNQTENEMLENLKIEDQVIDYTISRLREKNQRIFELNTNEIQSINAVQNLLKNGLLSI